MKTTIILITVLISTVLPKDRMRSTVTFVKFAYNDIELDSKSKEYLDRIFDSPKRPDSMKIDKVRLYTVSCIWEIKNNPYIGVQRAQNIIDYLEATKGMERHNFFIVNSLHKKRSELDSIFRFKKRVSKSARKDNCQSNTNGIEIAISVKRRSLYDRRNKKN